MFRYLCIAALLLVVSADPLRLTKDVPVPEVPTNNRIVGGEEIPITQAPYQVTLEYRGQFFCGGSIIGKDLVLTAAHCALSRDPSLIKVRAGSTFSQFGGSMHNVTKKIVHDDFGSDGSFANDIALLRISPAFEFGKSRKPIPLYKSGERSQTGIFAFISGFGVTEEGDLSGHLKGVKIPIIDTEMCHNAYEGKISMAPGQICAALYGAGGRDSCQGDSGGPLTINGRLAGVVSYGIGCGQPEYPGVYTEVAHFRNWIKSSCGI